MIRYTSEDSDICAYCGKKVEVDEFSGFWRIETRGNINDEKVLDPKKTYTSDELTKGLLVKKGKKNFKKAGI